MSSEHIVSHVLAWYDKGDESWVGEECLDISLEKLRQVVRPPENDPGMGDSYPVTQETVAQLGLSIEFDQRFDYFIESID